ncbi:MAG: sigma-70 family RNA polymerase sigma factor [Prevotellaceae bacterium]|jgi:RNA polymerase sigma-70 factor (ECF subfamily)|nr:sigma-70 family RNA polymerase sigma factor [Prevotellaceae bacterium]
MEESEINRLIELCKAGEQQAFAPIISEYQQMVFSIAFRLLCDEDEAKDSVQDTFVKIWLNLEKYDPSKSFRTWIYTVAINCCYDKIKIQKPKRIDEDVAKNIASPDNVEQKIQNKDLATIIVSLVGKLTPKQKIVFTLRYLEQLEMNEIEEITHLSREQIKNNLYLARMSIKRILEKWKI